MSQAVTNAINDQTKVLTGLSQAIAGIQNIKIDTSGFVNQQNLEAAFKTSLSDTNSILKEHTGLLQKIVDCCEEGNKKGSTTKTPASASNTTGSGGQAGIGKGVLTGIRSFAGKVGNVFGNALSGASSAIKGIGSGFSLASKGLFSFVKRFPALAVLGGILKGMWKVFETTIRYSAKLVKSLIGMSMQISAIATKIGDDFRNTIADINNQIEGVKDTFDLDSTIGEGFRRINDDAKQLVLTSSEVSNDLTKLFGTGTGAITQYINTLKTSFSSMGQFADVVAGSISKSTENALTFVKTTHILGLAGDDIKYFAMQSVKNLTSIYDTLDDVLFNIRETSSQFGVDRKLLSKNFMTLRKDITNFGHLSNQELTRTAARLTQLGVTGEAAIAVFNKMDTFESAAQSAALLSQAFGMNLDALQLIRAENPLEIVEMLRESMYMTGRSFDDLNRHEKALMSQHTGLNAEQLNMVMNYRSMGMAFDEIQKKLKESDPTAQQQKNIQSMEGSLKQITNVLKGTNIFSDFIEGAKKSLLFGTDLGERLGRAAKEVENFRMAGLKMSKTTRESLNNLLKPFTDSVDELFGTEGKAGIFNAENFSNLFEEFVDEYSVLFSRVFDKNFKLTQVQNDFTAKLNATFDADALMSSNNMGIQMLRTGGKVVGQFLRGFAAIGPGLIDIANNALTVLVDYLTEGTMGLIGGKSASSVLMQLFDLSEDDTTAIINTFNKLIDTLFGATGPLMRLFTWVQSAVLGLASQVGDAVYEAIFPSWLRATLGYVGYAAAGAGAVAATIGTGGIAPLVGAVALPAIRAGIGYLTEDDEEPIKQTNAKDWLSDALVGGKAVMQKSSSGLSVTRLDPNDQILAGMNGGPIVDAIRYSGNVAAGLADLITTNMERARETRASDVSNQRPIEVTLTLDSEVVTKVLLNNDLIGKAGRLEYTNGATRLTSTAQVNPTGGSTEASALG